MEHLYLLYNIAKKRKIILFISLQILAAVIGIKWKKINKFRKVLGPRRPRSQNRRRGGRSKECEDPFSFPLQHINIYERTGLFEDQFEQLFESLRVQMLFQPKTTSHNRRRRCRSILSLRSRLLLVLHWLRDYHKLRTLRDFYGVSISTISREISYLVPKIYCSLNHISWPTTVPDELVGIIDCTSHFRYRVHPRQADYYRADKHGFFITAQVVINLSGQLLNVHLGLGHNNDRGMFRITKMDERIEQDQVYLLADRGYSHHRLIIPDDNESQEWNNQQKGVRARVEMVIGLVKHFSVCSLVFRQSPELHEIALMTCYQLQAMLLREFPLVQ